MSKLCPIEIIDGRMYRLPPGVSVISDGLGRWIAFQNGILPVHEAQRRITPIWTAAQPPPVTEDALAAWYADLWRQIDAVVQEAGAYGGARRGTGEPDETLHLNRPEVPIARDQYDILLHALYRYRDEITALMERETNTRIGQSAIEQYRIIVSTIDWASAASPDE